jgi:hypothetical protein
MTTEYQNTPFSYRANLYIIQDSSTKLEEADVSLWLPLETGVNIAMIEKRFKKLDKPERKIYSVEYGTALIGPTAKPYTIAVEFNWKTDIVEIIEEFRVISIFVLIGFVLAAATLLVEVCLKMYELWSRYRTSPN